jgi:hypothetical protein
MSLPLIRTLPLVFLQLLCAEATRAEVVSLSCSGTSRVTAKPEQPWTFALIVDTDRKTVTVDDWPSVPFLEDPSKNVIAFWPNPPREYGVSTGTLNRITGETSIHILPVSEGGLQIIRGTCKPARKLF